MTIEAKPRTMKLQWKEGIKAPHEMCRHFSGMVGATTDGDIVYVRVSTFMLTLQVPAPSLNYQTAPLLVALQPLSTTFSPSLVGSVMTTSLTNFLASCTIGKVMWQGGWKSPTNANGASALCIKTALITEAGG